MGWIQYIFHQSPEIALFLSLAGGYAIGKIQSGKFQLGGVAGSLLVAVLISQIRRIWAFRPDWWVLALTPNLH